ncbi:MAG: hypothetical protein ABIH23_17285 [bacterium]
MDRTTQPVPAALLAAAFAVALFFLLGAMWACVRLDDKHVVLAGDQTYIDLLYSQNISTGIGPRYLPDHPKTLAPASSLRVALLSIVSAVLPDRLDLLRGVTLFSVLFLWLGLVIGSIWIRRCEGGGSDIAFLLLALTHGGILWLLWSGEPDTLIVPLTLACTLSLYGKPSTTVRLFITGISGFLLGLCGWPGYAYAIGTSFFLWAVAAREELSLRNPFKPVFWAAALPLLGGGSLLFANWTWTGLWDGGGPVALTNLVGYVSPMAVLRLDWSAGLFDTLSHFGSLGTSFLILPFIILPLALFGVVAGAEKKESEQAVTDLLPLFQFFCVAGFLGFLPEDRRQIEILPFLPVFLLFVLRGIRELARIVHPIQDGLSWMILLGLVVFQVWCLPDWYQRGKQQCEERIRRAILPAEEARAQLPDKSRIAAGDDPAFLWHIGPEFLRNGRFGSGYRMCLDLAGMEYAGVRRDTLHLLLEAPDTVFFPMAKGTPSTSSFPDVAAASAELVAASYEVQATEHTILFSRPDDVSVETIRERAAQRLLQTGRERDLLWAIVAQDLEPKPTMEQQNRWREQIDNHLSCLAGERWDFEGGLPKGWEVAGEGVATDWSWPVPIDGVRALSTGDPKHPERFGTVRSAEFAIEGDLLQLAAAGVGAATECYISLLIWESTDEQPLQPEPVRKAEHFHHWSGELLRGDVFFYLFPSELDPSATGWRGWRVVRRAGPGTPDSWTYIEWPVRVWRGMRAKWEICDRSTEGWIAVDHIRQMHRPPGRYWDFEDGTYEGWTVEGNAFGENPVLGPFTGQQPISGRQGDFLVNTYLGGSDMTAGLLRSATFHIDHQFLRFRIGGGDSHLKTALNLYVDGQLAQSASGQRDERLRTVTWDLGAVQGQEGQLEIADQETGAWGHVLVDDIALIGRDSL